MALLAATAMLVMAALLLWAGVEKTRHLGAVVATIAQFGIPSAYARAAAVLLAASELIVGAGLIFRPASALVLAGVLGLAGVFAAAGAVASLRGDAPIPCRCLGSHGSATLGFSQVAVFPLWVTGALLVWLENPHPPAIAQAVSSLAFVALILAAFRAYVAIKAFAVARGDRRSAREMYVWLRN